MVNEPAKKSSNKGRPKGTTTKSATKSSITKSAPMKEIKKDVVEEIKEEEIPVVEVEEVAEVIKSEPVKVIESAPVKVEKRTFDEKESIICRSVVSGGLYMDGIVSKMPYTWSDFGDEVGVEYRDLVAAVKMKNSYVMKPFFVIMDADFIEEFPFLKNVYEGQYSIKDLANVLTLPVDDMVEEIKKLPPNIKDTLKGIASTWVSNGRLDSFKKIKALDSMLDTDLSLIADMVNE